VPVPLEIRSLEVRRVRGDTALSLRASREFLAGASEGAIIEVVIDQPLGPPRSDAPVVFVDGKPVMETWPVPPDRLIAVVSDARTLREGAEITVGWLSDRERTRSRRPVPLTPAIMRPLQ
jgi:hypothetical protein